MAKAYAANAEPMTGAPVPVLVDTALALLASRPDAAAGRAWDVLDVAAGLGVAAALMVGRARATGAAVRVDATDFAPAMVEAASERLAGLAREVFVSDAQAMPERADASYDAVISNFGIFLVPDLPRALAEAARVLRPGGVLAFTAWEDDRWARSFMRSLARLSPDPETAGKVDAVLAGFDGMFDAERAVAATRAAGFDGVVVRRVQSASVLPSARAFVGTFIGMPFLRGPFAAVADEGPAREAFMAAAVAEVERVAGHPEPCVANRELFLVTATKS